MLGGMAKNVYDGIFQNYIGFTIYDLFFVFVFVFFHSRLGVMGNSGLESPISYEYFRKISMPALVLIQACMVSQNDAVYKELALTILMNA